MEDVKRFVIQRHTRQNEAVHWDLMLRVGEVLQTYRLDVPPERISAQPIKAVKIFDHPLRFLSYEGAVNEGKGMVAIADAGTYEVTDTDSQQRTLRFSGRILTGPFSIRHIESDRYEFASVKCR